VESWTTSSESSTVSTITTLQTLTTMVTTAAPTSFRCPTQRPPGVQQFGACSRHQNCEGDGNAHSPLYHHLLTSSEWIVSPHPTYPSDI
jgi:hypothetical protein